MAEATAEPDTAVAAALARMRADQEQVVLLLDRVVGHLERLTTQANDLSGRVVALESGRGAAQ